MMRITLKNGEIITGDVIEIHGGEQWFVLEVDHKYRVKIEAKDVKESEIVSEKHDSASAG